MGRRTRSKAPNSSIMRAIANYVHKKPANVDNIVANAVFKSGKPIRMSRMSMTTRQLAGTLAGHKDFFMATRHNKNTAAEWGIDPKSKLLKDYIERKDSDVIAAKKKRIGKKAYEKQLKARRKAPSYHREKRGNIQ